MDPWSKGDYSRHIREALMVVEKLPEINPPSGRVPGRGLLAIPILESLRRRNSGENRDAGSLFRVSGMGCKYRPKGGIGGGPLHPGGHLARPRMGPRPLAAWAGGGPPPTLLRSSGVFWNADFLYIFLEIFGHCKYGYKPAIHRHQQIETGTGCTELVG